MTRRSSTRYRLDIDAVRRAMDEVGYTALGPHMERSLAVASDIPLPAIRTYLRGQVSNPSASYIFQLADALGVDPRDLMKETDI